MTTELCSVVCADCIGMTRSVKEITKLEKISLSDFTLCKAELLHTEERKTSVFHGLFVPAVPACLEV